jgi:GntR family transcriptional regulator
MIYLDYGDPRPLYEQVREKMKTLIIRGVLSPHDQIPTVREMAVSLTVNPNTIQKAYKDLESEGYIYSVKGKGSFVTHRSSTTNERRLEDLRERLRPIFQELSYLGLTGQDAADWIRDLLPDHPPLLNHPIHEKEDDRS